MKPENIVKFLIEAGKLKRVKRKGWVIHGIKNPESVAEHSFRTALMAAILADKFSVNREKTVIMALIHDLAESVVGDISLHDKISKKEKHEKEKKAFEKLTSVLGDKELYNLWLEFEKGKTKEAQLVRQLDKLEMHLQAMEYEWSQKRDLSEFFSLVDNEVKNKELKKLLNVILKTRKS